MKGAKNRMFEVKRRGRPSKCPDVKTLSDLYEQYTSRQIAEKYGVSKSTAKGWIYRARSAAQRGGACK